MTSEAGAGRAPDTVFAAGAAGGSVTTLPNTAEGLLADRQAFWGNFTRVVLWSTVVVAAVLVLLVWAVL